MGESSRPPGLIQRYRQELEVRHYARRTVNTYEQWLRRFLRFHGLRHPRTMGSAEVNAFLTHLAVELKVSPSTQNQGLAALLFLYRELLAIDLDLDGVVRARTRRRLPVVLTPEEVRAVLAELGGVEALRLRMKDLDFARRELTVRDGKGGKDRRTLLPSSLEGGLQEHLEAVRRLHRADLAAGFGHVALPHALARKYPRAPVARFRERPGGAPPPGSQCDPESGTPCRAGSRHHKAGHAPHLPPFLRHPPPGARPGHPHDSGADGPSGCENNHDLHHVLNRGPLGVNSPVDLL